MYGQVNDKRCRNIINLYLEPVEVINTDSSEHNIISRNIRNFVISSQQEYGYKLVEHKFNASEVLHVTYRVNNMGFPNQQTEINWKLCNIQDSTKILSYSDIHSTPEETWKKSKDVISKEDFYIIDVLQKTVVLGVIFPSVNGVENYRPRAMPEIVILINDFEVDKSLEDEARCIKQLFSDYLKQIIAFKKREINVYDGNKIMKDSFSKNPFLVLGSLERREDNYLMTLMSEDYSFVYEVLISSKTVEMGLFRPFIHDELSNAVYLLLRELE
ncbi:MAG: hypothetical protein ACJAWV_000219 [Flammeovirgaceae bacterium]|jgi:hypothetical protein